MTTSKRTIVAIQWLKIASNVEVADYVHNIEVMIYITGK